MLKKYYRFILLITIIFLLTACGKDEGRGIDSTSERTRSKVTSAENEQTTEKSTNEDSIDAIGQEEDDNKEAIVADSTEIPEADTCSIDDVGKQIEAIKDNTNTKDEETDNTESGKTELEEHSSEYEDVASESETTEDKNEESDDTESSMTELEEQPSDDIVSESGTAEDKSEESNDTENSITEAEEQSSEYEDVTSESETIEEIIKTVEYGDTIRAYLTWKMSIYDDNDGEHSRTREEEMIFVVSTDTTDVFWAADTPPNGEEIMNNVNKAIGLGVGDSFTIHPHSGGGVVEATYVILEIY